MGAVPGFTTKKPPRSASSSFFRVSSEKGRRVAACGGLGCALGILGIPPDLLWLIGFVLGPQHIRGAARPKRALDGDRHLHVEFTAAYRYTGNFCVSRQ